MKKRQIKEEKFFEIKNVSDEKSESRTFSGWLSTYGNVDSDGDVFEKGAFKDAIKNRNTYPLLFNHKGNNLDDYIGEFKAFDKPEGVWIEAKLFEDDKNADKVYSMLKSGALQEMSIGFRIEDWEKDAEWIEDEKRDPFWGGGFNFKKSLIREGSVVLAPANLQATVEEVKNQKRVNVNFDFEKFQEDMIDYMKENMKDYIKMDEEDPMPKSEDEIKENALSDIDKMVNSINSINKL